MQEVTWPYRSTSNWSLSFLDEIRALADETHRPMDDVNKLYVENVRKIEFGCAHQGLFGFG